MEITKQILEEEVKNYNNIIEEMQKINKTLNEWEQKRLKSWGKLEFIESILNNKTESVKDIKIDEVIKDGKKSKLKT